jgi:gamma-glutamyltranspeptidase
MFNCRKISIGSWTLAVLCLAELELTLAASIGQRWVKSGAVASESKTCSQIGIDLMKAGGNAVDAV